MTDLKSEAYAIWRRLNDPNTPLTEELAVDYIRHKLQQIRDEDKKQITPPDNLP